MPAQHRLDVWRSERRRLLRELTFDPENAVFRDDLDWVETRIRSYEDMLAEADAGAGVARNDA